MKRRLFSCFLMLQLAVIYVYGQTPMLWGMTYSGGDDNAGSIFSYDIAANAYTEVFHFNESITGAFPIGALTPGHNGVLYGLTKEGGFCDNGVLFSYTMQGGVYTTLHSFGCDTDGSYPGTSLYLAGNGLFYGVVNTGGLFNGGMIFSYDIATNTYTHLYTFNGNAGAEPAGSFVSNDGNLLYATASTAGLNNAGTIFTYNIATGAVNVVYNFVDTVNESQPGEYLVMEGDSLLYGSVFSGAVRDYGYMFCFNIRTASYRHVRNFDTPYTGYQGGGPLVRGTDGLIYGVASAGGNFGGSGNASGLLFSYSAPNDSERILHYFGNGDDAAFPVSSLMQASDGLLYGMTDQGGHFREGAIFSYNLTDTLYTVLHHFSGQPDGAYPWGPMVEAALPTGIPTIAAEGPLQVWPNPTTGGFRIKLPDNATGCEVEVFNILGQKIGAQILTPTQNFIDLTGEPAGMYFVYLHTQTRVLTGKVSLVK